jgi:hypothetical protein
MMCRIVAIELDVPCPNLWSTYAETLYNIQMNPAEIPNVNRPTTKLVNSALDLSLSPAVETPFSFIARFFGLVLFTVSMTSPGQGFQTNVAV